MDRGWKRNESEPPGPDTPPGRPRVFRHNPAPLAYATISAEPHHGSLVAHELGRLRLAKWALVGGTALALGCLLVLQLFGAAQRLISAAGSRTTVLLGAALLGLTLLLSRRMALSLRRG